MPSNGSVGLAWVTATGTVRVSVAFGLNTMLACGTLVIPGLQVGGLALVAPRLRVQTRTPPAQPSPERWLDRMTLERGLILGAPSACWASRRSWRPWRSGAGAPSGALDRVVTLRLPVLGMVLIVGVTQVAGAAFAISLTGIRRSGGEETEAADRPG